MVTLFFVMVFFVGLVIGLVALQNKVNKKLKRRKSGMDYVFKEAFGGMKSEVKAVGDEINIDYKAIEERISSKLGFGTLVRCPHCEKRMMYTGDKPPAKTPLCPNCEKKFYG